MNERQIQALKENCGLPDTCNNMDFKETHISWIILTDNYAFKIKRPVQYSFLDFTSLEKREHYCREELELNKRLASDMYLKVIPITQEMLEPEKNDDSVIDYAVQMKRMDNSKEMGALLEQDGVKEEDIDKLAKHVAEFHKKTRIIKNVFNTTGFQKNYAEILEEYAFVEENIGKEWAEKMKSCTDKSNVYLNKRRNYMNDRIIRGFVKDCHGDLNAHNIFLYDNPVIFDCIEYNKEFRHIDIYYEIAFLCVDLEFYDKDELSNLFHEKYIEYMKIKEDAKDKELLNYYKSFRANIRAKVTILHEKSQNNSNAKSINDIKRYIELMHKYMK